MTKIHIDILNRYDDFITKYNPFVPISCMPDEQEVYPCHIRWMIQELKNTDMETGKANRWLGFIQGFLILEGYTTIGTERDFTRPYFKIDEGI